MDTRSTENADIALNQLELHCPTSCVNVKATGENMRNKELTTGCNIVHTLVFSLIIERDSSTSSLLSLHVS